MKKRILKLTAMEEWFYLIAGDKKKTEYRLYKQHWISRLMTKEGDLREYDEVHITNGYGGHRPFLRTEWKRNKILLGKEANPENNEPLDPFQKYFAIGLGRILETRNLAEPTQSHGKGSGTLGNYEYL